MKKKILSGILAFMMCFTMMPSMAWSSETAEFSSGEEIIESVNGEGVFTDEVNNGLGMQSGETPEAENWSDGSEDNAVNVAMQEERYKEKFDTNQPADIELKNGSYLVYGNFSYEFGYFSIGIYPGASVNITFQNAGVMRNLDNEQQGTVDIDLAGKNSFSEIANGGRITINGNGGLNLSDQIRGVNAEQYENTTIINNGVVSIPKVENQNIIINGGSVKFQQPNSLQVKNSNGENVYSCIIPNPLGEEVKIDGNIWNQKNHSILDSEDTNLYAYLTGESHKIFVGNKEFRSDFNTETGDFILKAVPTSSCFTYKQPENCSYDGQEKYAEVTCASGIIGMGNIKVTYFDFKGNKLENPPASVGTYFVKVGVEEGENYTANPEVSDENWKFTISPTLHIDNITYGQQTEPNIQVLGKPEDSTVSYQYKFRGSDDNTYHTIDVSSLKMLPAGEYTLKAIVSESGNYEGGSVTCDFEITKADISGENSEVKIKGWTYGSYNERENRPSVDNVINPGNGNVTYTYYTDANCNSLTTLANSGATGNGELPKNVGTYYVKAEISATDNYNSTTAKGSFKIEPRLAELEWSDSKLTYNGEEQKVTAIVKNAVSGDNFNLTYDNNIGKEAGNYTTMVKGLGNINYSLSKDGILIDTISHSWKIEPKEITVKPNDVSKHIGKIDPELTYTADGLVPNEELTGITLTRDAGEGSGTYKITATEDENANPNYKVKTETGIFTINGHSWSEPEIKIKPTAWSEGKEERTCTECGQKRYDTIPENGEPKDEYADRIEKYVQGSGTEDKNTIREATLNNKETQLLDELNIFGAEEKNKIKNRKATAKVWIELTAATLTKEQEDAIRKEAEKFAGTNAKLCPFDMNLFRQMNDESQVQITDSGINMNIRFRIPDDMINNQSYTIRNYKIIRLHNGTTDILDTSFNSNTNEITFETNKFSVYALTYKDTYYSPSYPVTGIKVSPDTLTLTKKDETAQLTAEVTPSYADNKRVTWKSSDEKVATVDENGKVTAVSNGTATITATSVSGNYTATVSVTVKILVEIEKITIETEKEILTKIGESTELKVKIEPENADPQKLTWKSSDEKVAIVDENGKVTAVANGTATITVTTEDGKHTASVTITVNIPDEPVISNTTGFGRLKARSTKQTKTSVTLEWSRIDDADGYFIYGSRCNTSTKSYKYKKLATITNGNTRTWTQKDLKKATYYKYVVKAYKIVNGKKVVTDTSASVHTVTQGGKYGVAKSVSVTKIGNKKNVTKLTLKKGKTAQITAKEIKKDNKIKQHRNLCYESSNTKVATVTSKGLIRAVGKGTCTIWVYAQNGVYKALTITVK